MSKLNKQAGGRFKSLVSTPTVRYKSVAEGGVVCGYASTFDREPDAYGDVVAPGAFTETLEEWKGLNGRGVYIPLLWNHDSNDPKNNIGRVVVAYEDVRGLYIEAEFDQDNEYAQYVRKLVKEGRAYQFSFAYAILDQADVKLPDGTTANELRKLDLFEVSLVQVPANQHAEVTDIKATHDVDASFERMKFETYKRELIAHIKNDQDLMALVEAEELEARKRELLRNYGQQA